jgi:hypothetical protein
MVTEVVSARDVTYEETPDCWPQRKETGNPDDTTALHEVPVLVHRPHPPFATVNTIFGSPGSNTTRVSPV